MTSAGLHESARAPLAVRGHDLYESPPEAVHALAKAERLPHRIWEPACGPGVIARTLRGYGHSIVATDLVDYASPDQDASGRDFLLEWRAPDGGKLARVHVFRNRLPMMHRAGWDGNKVGPRTAYAWFVWDAAHDGPATLHRISWEAVGDEGGHGLNREGRS